MNERCVDGGESLARLLVQQSKFKHPVAWNGWCTHTYILDVPGQPYIYHTHTYRGTSHKNHGFLHPETNVMVWGVTRSKFDGQGVTKITANIVVT